jgi:Ribbon-helix-helix protein, copG family
MVRTQIQLTEEQAKALKRIAQSRHLSVAELVRKAVDSMIKSSTAVNVEERRKRALEIVGKFGSGKRDISKKHDLYLADAYHK